MLIRQKFVSLQSCYYRYVMDNRLKRQAALYMLISLVDENNGSIDINSDAIRRSFNDDDQTVMVEKSDGTIALAAEMDGEILDKAVRKWIANNPRKFEAVRSKLNPKMMNYMVN